MGQSNLTSLFTTGHRPHFHHKKNTSRFSTIPFEKNWAFLDMQNIYKGVQDQGWRINWKLFRKHLLEKYGVTQAYAFMGYLREYRWLYKHLKDSGFRMALRPARRLSTGGIKGGNVDTDLVSFMMDNKYEYEQAILIADDYIYCSSIESLQRQNKLRIIISPHTIKNTSADIKQVVHPRRLISIHTLKNHIS